MLMKILYNKISKVMLNKWITCAISSIVLVSCTTDPNSPGIEYMPDMYRPQTYEAYLEKYDIDSVKFVEKNISRYTTDFDGLSDSAQNAIKEDIGILYSVFNNGTATFKPVDGTVPVGHMPFTVAKNNRDGAKGISMPLVYDEQNMKEGKVYYSLFCDHCHGEKGDGNGPMVTLGVYPVQPPAYNAGSSATITAGEIYHTIYYGKGMMGAHASQISEDKRWKIVMYVQQLQGNTLEQLSGVVSVVVTDSLQIDSIK